MMQTTSTIPNALPPSAARLKGRARGALICGIFGTAWMFDAVFFGEIVTPASLTLIVFFTAVFVGWPLARIRSLRHLAYSPADRQSWRTVSTPFWTDFAIEWLACAGAAIWLAHIRRYDLIPQWTGAIIGVHFLPLGKIFRMPIYYATGAIMVLGVLASLVFPIGSVRNIVACGAMGLSLWATAAVILCQDGVPFRQGKDIRLAS